MHTQRLKNALSAVSELAAGSSDMQACRVHLLNRFSAAGRIDAATLR